MKPEPADAALPLSGPPNVTGFSPGQVYEAMTSQAFANAVFYIIHRHLNQQGRTTAWNAVVTLADLILPAARSDFGNKYGAAVRAWSERKLPPDDAIRQLFLLCELELRETGRLGKAKLPVSQHNPLLEGIR